MHLAIATYISPYNEARNEFNGLYAIVSLDNKTNIFTIKEGENGKPPEKTRHAEHYREVKKMLPDFPPDNWLPVGEHGEVMKERVSEYETDTSTL